MSMDVRAEQQGEEAEDATLVAAAQRGDFDAFDALVGRHEKRLYALARGILRDEHAAEDAVQNAFLQALEHLGEFRGESSFRTWIGRIAVNSALHALRKRRGLPLTPLYEAATEEGEIPHPEAVAPWRNEPLAALEREELRGLLDTAIASLPEPHRLVFLLRDVEGLPVAETASALGLSAANVKVRLLRARLALREALTKQFGDETRRARASHEHEGGTTTLAETLLQSYLAR